MTFPNFDLCGYSSDDGLVFLWSDCVAVEVLHKTVPIDKDASSYLYARNVTAFGEVKEKFAADANIVLLAELCCFVDTVHFFHTDVLLIVIIYN